MKASLLIGQFELAEMLKEDGLSYTPIVRKSKTVTTIDGTEYRHEVIKKSFKCEFLDLDEATYQTLLNSVTGSTVLTVSEYASPAAIKGGTAITGYYYVDDLQHGVERVIGTRSFFSDVSLTLTER